MRTSILILIILYATSQAAATNMPMVGQLVDPDLDGGMNSDFDNGVLETVNGTYDDLIVYRPSVQELSGSWTSITLSAAYSMSNNYQTLFNFQGLQVSIISNGNILHFLNTAANSSNCGADFYLVPTGTGPASSLMASRLYSTWMPNKIETLTFSLISSRASLTPGNMTIGGKALQPRFPDSPVRSPPLPPPTQPPSATRPPPPLPPGTPVTSGLKYCAPITLNVNDKLYVGGYDNLSRNWVTNSSIGSKGGFIGSVSIQLL